MLSVLRIWTIICTSLHYTIYTITLKSKTIGKSKKMAYLDVMEKSCAIMGLLILTLIVREANPFAFT